MPITLTVRANLQEEVRKSGRREFGNVIVRQVVTCLDYFVAKEGKLVAYRWHGESVLIKENFSHAMLRS